MRQAAAVSMVSMPMRPPSGAATPGEGEAGRAAAENHHFQVRLRQSVEMGLSALLRTYGHLIMSPVGAPKMERA